MKGKEYKNTKLSTKTKQVYFFKFTDDEFPERKIKEIHVSRGTEIHYPFYDNKPRYKYVEEVIFDHVSYTDIKGVQKASSRGLGFTRDLSPIVKELERFPRISKIKISKKIKTRIKSNQITININDLENFYSILKPFNDKQYAEKKKMANNLLANVLPNKFKKITVKYTKGDLIQFIVEKDLENNKLSQEDVQHIVKILPKEIKEQQIVYQVEEKIKLIKLKNALREFEKLSQQETETKSLEKRWHSFFKKNDWIFSHVLLLPVTIYDDEVYVGGKSAKNEDGKVADFLYRSSLTNNACLVEIKTHRSKICNKTAYRGTNVFELNGSFTGALNQALRQKHQIQKDYSALLSQEMEAGTMSEFFEVFNPRLVLIAGTLKELTKKQRNNFEIFRNSITGIEITTFDEVKEKISYLLDLLEVEQS